MFTSRNNEIKMNGYFALKQQYKTKIRFHIMLNMIRTD